MLSMRRARSWLFEHQAFVLLLAAFTVFRLLSIVALRPGGFLASAGPDQSYYFDIGRLAGSGQIAYFDFWMEYPPLMPWLAALAYRISLYFLSPGSQIFWFNLFFRLTFLPFTMGALCLVYASVGRLAGRERALQAAGLWALLFAPFFTFLSWFEPLVLFFLLLGLYGLLTDRPWLVGIATGLGFMAKVFPIIYVPVALFGLRSHRQRAVYAASALASAGLVVLPPLLVTPRYVVAMFDALRSVSSWETVWALLEGYKGYGIVAPLASRVDSATAAFSVHPSSLPWIPITLAFAAIYGLAITRRINWTDKGRVAQFSLFSLTVFILYNKGYSPQWAAHLGTLALVALPLSRGLAYALLLDGLLVAEWPIAFIALGGQSEFLLAVIVVRTALIVLLGLDALARVYDAPVWRFLRRAALPAASVVFLGGALAVAAPTWRAFTAARLQEEPLAPLIQSVRQPGTPADPIVIVQPELLERLRPLLPDKAILLFPNAGGVPWAQADEWLPTVLKPYDRAWLLYDNSDDAHRTLFAGLQNWFDAKGSPNMQTWYGTVRAGHYVVAPFAAERACDAQFAGPLHLVAATLPDAPLRPGSAFALRLKWEVSGQLPKDYAVFVQVLSSDGKLVAQSDTWPSVPTSRWGAGQVTTSHGLFLPSDLPAGAYRIYAGLYDASGARLPLADGGDAAALGDLVVHPAE